MFDDEINPCLIAWSARTKETTASTTGGALGTTHGSCRPGTFNLACVPFERSRVSCVCAIEDGGLNPILITKGIPVESPPRIPPELFVLVTTDSFSKMYVSLFSEPGIAHP